MATATVIASLLSQPIGLQALPLVLSGNPVQFPIIVTNTGSTPATISSVTPLIQAAGSYTFLPPAIPPGGLTVPAGASLTLIASATFNPNLNIGLGLQPNQQFNLAFQINFSDGTSAGSNAVSVSPLPNSPGETTFYLPSNSGLLLALGM